MPYNIHDIRKLKYILDYLPFVVRDISRPSYLSATALFRELTDLYYNNMNQFMERQDELDNMYHVLIKKLLDQIRFPEFDNKTLTMHVMAIYNIADDTDDHQAVFDYIETLFYDFE